jgi:ribonuclease-3
VNGNIKCPQDCLALQECSNERLEFFGDSVLNLVVAQYLYERFPESEEGFLTKIRTRLVNGQMLAVLSEKIGLDRYMLISKQIEDNGGRKNMKILEDTFEALIGALFLDFGKDGFEMASDFIVTIIETNIDFSELIMSNNNYKDMLLKYFQHNLNYLPKFYELSVENKQNGKEYTVCIKNKEGLAIATGTGCNKKQSENQAARNALVYYGQI